MLRVTLIALLVVSSVCGICRATTLIGVAPVNGQRVVSINRNTGSTSDLTILPSGTISDIATWPGEPRAVWMLGFPSSGSTSITKIDALTGIVSYSATLPHIMEGLTIDPSDGQLYASNSANNIYRFARGSTNLELVGNASVVTGSFRLAFDSAGKLYGASSSTFYSIDKLTAAPTTLGIMNGVSTTVNFDFAFRPEDDVLYALGNYNLLGYQLFTIDPANGSTSPIGRSIVRPNGIAFVTIPEPTALTLFCLGWFSYCDGDRAKRAR